MSELASAAAPAGHHVLYGAEVSYYTAKIRAYLACKRIPFVERLATRAVFAEEILPRVGWPVIPVLVTPEGVTVQDTSDMIDLLEARYPVPPALPPGGVGRVLSYLLELLGDEWLKLPALHYRWHYDYDFAVAEFGRNNDPELAPDEQRRIGAKIAARFQGWREPLGINAASVPAIEADYLAFLAALDRHFAVMPWLLGATPSLGDFAFYGPLYAHLYRDPNSGQVLRAHAPRVADWIERLRDGPACAPLPARPRRDEASADRCAHVVQGLVRFRPARVIGIDVDRAHDTRTVDDQPCRHRQGPAVLTVRLGQVDAETQVDRLQFRRYRKAQPEPRAIGIARIAQEVERQRVLAHHLEAARRRLRRECEQGRAERTQFIDDFLQSVQLRHAVGSPVPAEYRQHHRATRQQVFRADLDAVGVDQRERRQRLADLDDAVQDPGLAQGLGRGMHGGERGGGNAFGRAVADQGERVFERHVDLLLVTPAT